MRALVPTLVSVQVMLMHPKRRIQVILAFLVVLGLFSYVVITPSNNVKNIEPKREAFKELLAPGPSKDFPDFDYKYDNHKKSRKISSTSSTQASAKLNNFVLDEVILKSTKSSRDFQIHSQKARRKNRLNGVPLGVNLDEFDAVGQTDLFKHNQVLDDR